jgi:hypothetical protein
MVNNPTLEKEATQINLDLTRFKSVEDICREIFSQIPIPKPPMDATLTHLEQHITAHLIFHGPISLDIRYNRPFPIKYLSFVKLFEGLSEKFAGLTIKHNALLSL